MLRWLLMTCAMIKNAFSLSLSGRIIIISRSEVGMQWQAAYVKSFSDLVTPSPGQEASAVRLLPKIGQVTSFSEAFRGGAYAVDGHVRAGSTSQGFWDGSHSTAVSVLPG